jgi:tetratricopeptide (TPR) repeat protein
MLPEPETSCSSVTADALPEDMAKWVTARAEEAVASGFYSPAAMTRASDYCLRGKFQAAACILSRAAVPRAEGLLPVYIQALRCAIQERDADQAMVFTRQAIDAALHPPAVLYEKYVGLKAANDPVATDNDMVEALKVLRQADPNNPLWAQMLGYVRFQRGGWEVIDALYQMTDAIQHGATNRTPYVIAAESARLLDRYDRAAELLRQGLGLFPGDTELLNNLTYTLAQDEGTIEQALDMLPGLLQKAREDLRVLDTASTVYTRSGLVDKAEIIVKEILSRVTEGSRSWFRASVRAAEIAYLRGEFGAAAEALRELVRKCGNMPDEDILSATRLMEEVEKSILRESGPTSAGRVKL